MNEEPNGRPEPARVRRLAYIGLGATDLRSWETFATSILGLEVAGTSSDGGLHLREDKFHHTISIHPSETEDILYVGWEVQDDTAFASFVDSLRKAGRDAELGTSAEVKDRGVLELVRTRDPDGTIHEICYGNATVGDPFVAAATSGKFITGPLGMGHLTVNTAAFGDYVRFCRDVLGMRRTSTRWIESGPVEGVSTWRCNRRHHSVAVIGFREPQQRRLSHFGLHVNELDHVGVAYDKALDANLVEVTLGRHQGDNALSFYLRTPSGFQIEYVWQGREIPEDAPVDQVVGPPSIWGHRPVTGKAEDRALFADPSKRPLATGDPFHRKAPR